MGTVQCGCFMCIFVCIFMSIFLDFITAARPAYAGTEGCSILHVFLFFFFFI